MNFEQKILLVLGLLSGCAAGPPQSVPHLSVADLNASSAEFDGRAIVVRGYVRFTFEGCRVSDSEKEATYENSLWYWPQGNCYDLRSTSNPKQGPGLVYGIFHEEDGGHLGVTSKGAIRDAKVYWD